MGGFYQTASLMDKWYTTVADKAGQRAIDAFFAMSRSFEDHPTGKLIRDQILKGIKVRQQSLDKYRAPVNEFEQFAKKDPKLATMHDYSKATIGQIHASLPQGHAAKNILDPLMVSKRNHTRTLEDIKRIAVARANLDARNAVFGKDSVHLANLLDPMYHSPNPADQTRADAWLDIASQIFRDNRNTFDEGKINVASGIKTDVADNINQKRQALGLDPLDISVKPSYKSVDAKTHLAEQKWQRYTLTVLAPWIALVHTTDLFKLPMEISGATLWKTLNTLDDATINAMKASSGIFVHTQHSIWDNDFLYRTGKIANITDMPQAAAILHKLYHQPLFNPLRMKELSFFGTAAYHSAQEWGWKAFQGSQYAADHLKAIGIDPNKVINRGGILTDPELEDAIFHFTNNRLFIDNPLERSKLANSSPFWRVAYLLHGFATKESRLMGHTLYRAAVNHEYTKIAQWAAVVMGIFPFMAAPAIKSLGILARTADPREALDDYKETYKRLSHPLSHPGEFSHTYFDLLAHFGGVGAFWSIFRSAVNHRLLASMAGPGPEAAATTGEEWLRVADDFWEGKNYRPELRKALRDSLHYTIPVFGNIAQHWMFPQRKRHQPSIESEYRKYYQHRRYQ